MGIFNVVMDNTVGKFEFPRVKIRLQLKKLKCSKIVYTVAVEFTSFREKRVYQLYYPSVVH